jgi:pyruvate carboxylase
MEPLDFKALKEDLEDKHGEDMSDKDVMSAALYPKVFDDYCDFRRKYGPVTHLDTKTFLVGPDIAQEHNVSLTYVGGSMCECLLFCCRLKSSVERCCI